MSTLLPEIIDAEISVNREENNVSAEITETEQDELSDEDIEVEQEVIPKQKIPQDKIFAPPKVKSVAKKKRVMDDKKLEQLAKARAKAKENAKKKKEEREAEVSNILQQKKQEYIEKKVSKHIKKQEKEVDAEPVINVNKGISHDDIQNIVSQSITAYDTDRKKRKEEKKKKQAQDQQHQRINNTIRKAQGLPPALNPNDAGYFNSCFG